MFDLFGFGFAQVDPSQPPQQASPELYDEEDDDDAGISDEINDVMTNVMPWLITLMLHVAIVVIAIFTVWVLVEEVEKEQPVVPIVKMGPTPGAPLVVNREQKKEKQSSSRRTQSKKVTKTKTAVNAQSQITDPELGVSGGPEATASPFGTGPNVGEGLSVGMYGNGGNAKSVVYVIDASGSLFDTMPFVVDELKRSIGQLSAGQTFTIIFFQGGDVIEPNFTRAMKSATGELKQKAIEWVDLNNGNVAPRGRTDPRSAIKQALSYRPQLMILLSDNIVGTGKFGLEPEDLIDAVKESNIANTKINCIQFIYPDPLTRFGQEPTLKRISDQTGGKYKFVSEDELHAR